MKIYDRVKLLTDKYLSENVKTGSIGYIVEDYGDGNYEVEFSDPNGNTVAIFAIPKADLEIDE